MCFFCDHWQFGGTGDKDTQEFFAGSDLLRVGKSETDCKGIMVVLKDSLE